MLSPSDIKPIAERKYPAYLRSLVTGENIFPIEIRFGQPSTTDAFPKLQQEVTALEKRNFGYTIEWEIKNTRNYGTQKLPKQVRFDSGEQFVNALGKQMEVRLFQINLSKTLARLPELKDWMASHVKWVLDFGDIWGELLLVCEYFKANPRPGLYIRQLPIAVHTKFIKENTKVLSSLLSVLLPNGAITEGDTFEERFGLKPLEPMILFRALDSDIPGRLGLAFAEMGLPLDTFCKLHAAGLRVIITENLMNFECIPDIRNGLAIWGQGNAAELLHSVEWLTKCDVYYWGDIDEHGFHILARLRSKFQSIHSFLMDKSTLDEFRGLVGSGEKAGKAPVNLTDAERLAFDEVERENIRLEQEKIPQKAVVAAMANFGLYRIAT